MGQQQYDACSLDDVRDAINYLDYDHRETWVSACFAIKSEFGESGFDVWDNWGRQYKNYRASDALCVWRSDRGGPMGISWLFARATEQGYKRSRDTSEADRARLRAEREARAEVLEKERAADAAWCLAMADKVAAIAATVVEQFTKTGGLSEYVKRKQIKAAGALYPTKYLLIVTHVKNGTVELITEGAAIAAFWVAHKVNKDALGSVCVIKPGCLIIPMRTPAGELRNLQVIYPKETKKSAAKRNNIEENKPRDKTFLKCGDKSGTAIVLGDAGAQGPFLLCEGYATGCSLHESTKLPVVVGWDCWALVSLAPLLRAAGFTQDFLVCGDDDSATKGNPGYTKAIEAARILNGAAIIPIFKNGAGADRTDFNDLHVSEGLGAVAAQINAGLQRLHAAPVLTDAPPLDAYDDYDLPAANEPTTLPPAPDVMLPPNLEGCFKRYALIADNDQGKIWDSHQQKILKQKAVKDFITPEVFKLWMNDTANRRTTTLSSVLPLAQKSAAAIQLGGGGLRDALGRYVYLNPSQNVWDGEERQVVAVNDLRIAIASCYSDWVQHPERQEIKAANLVFDPTQNTPVEGYINRFTGLPLVPKRNDDKCENIRHLLSVLCNYDGAVGHWLACWLAYPLQNIGAKMRSAVLMHSDVHGSGKSFFFDGVMRAIYGKYCRTLGQTQLESQYNDWLSEILFGVFEEVLSRGQKYSHTGTLKQLVTGQTFRVEKKFMSGWEESNHMNAVFLSNEVQPMPIEPSDRRFLVVWPETKLIDALKDGVAAELENGGAEAFYAWLLDYPVGKFNEFTEPPVTEAKRRIIEHGKSTWEHFYDEWKSGELEYPYCSVRVKDLFRAYDRYCSQRRESCMGQGKFISFIHSKERKKQTHVHYKSGRWEGKATFILVRECPPDLTRQVWLGNCVMEWERILNKHANEDSFAQAS